MRHVDVNNAVSYRYGDVMIGFVADRKYCLLNFAIKTTPFVQKMYCFVGKFAQKWPPKTSELHL